VEDTFTQIHEYLRAFSGKTDLLKNGRIKLGDYVDLPSSFAVVAYGGKGVIAANSLPAGSDKLRLIVVGINSFNAQGSYKGSGSMETGGPDPAIPHIVLHFKDTPVDRRMEVTSTNVNGYLGSEMRKYLVDYNSSGGNFSVGLKNAGVPLDEDIIWAPKRYVANGGNGATDADLIEDKIWLPTVWEIFDCQGPSVAAYETETNQARLEYYDSPEKRWKSSGFNNYYWMGSPASGPIGMGYMIFCYANPNNSDTGLNGGGAEYDMGVAPAFCVR
jgi:hypothetical protein